MLFHNPQHENTMPQDYRLKRIDVAAKNLANDLLITGPDRVILHFLKSPGEWMTFTTETLLQKANPDAEEPA
jgi:hypothetical protein